MNRTKSVEWRRMSRVFSGAMLLRTPATQQKPAHADGSAKPRIEVEYEDPIFDTRYPELV